MIIKRHRYKIVLAFVLVLLFISIAINLTFVLIGNMHVRVRSFSHEDGSYVLFTNSLENINIRYKITEDERIITNVDTGEYILMRCVLIRRRDVPRFIAFYRMGDSVRIFMEYYKGTYSE